MNSAKRIISNTGFLYAKMLITMLIALFSTRFILQALGAEDFGIFSLVSGILLMLAFVNAAMATSSQRFISFYLGQGETGRINTIFRTSFQLHLFLAVFLALIFEVIGIFLFHDVLNIPGDRLNAAKMVYHFMVVSTFFTICSVPYVASITAHEDFRFESFLGIVEAVLKLVVAVLLMFSGADRLILYGALMAGIIILSCTIKAVFGQVKYQECKKLNLFIIDYVLMREMFSFACWNMFGALCGVGTVQGTAVILNMFFGTNVNAAYGVARQISTQTASFSSNMLRALTPNIVRNEGKGDRQKMLYLSMVASRFGYYLLAFFAVPLIAETPFVLTVWLKTVPEYAGVFCRLILIGRLAAQVTIGLRTAAQAVGKIKIYQSVVGGLLLLNLPVSWLALKSGYDAHIVFVIAVFMELVALVSRIFFLRKIANLSAFEYIKRVIIPVCSCTMIVSLTIIIIQNFMPFGWSRLFTVIFVSSLSFCGTIYFIGMDQHEKHQISGLVNAMWKKIKVRVIA